MSRTPISTHVGWRRTAWELPLAILCGAGFVVAAELIKMLVEAVA